MLIDAIPREHSRIRRIQSAQHRYLCLEAEVFEDRVAAGRVVDGHGDLRPEHIYLDGRPVVIDCIEFSDELRTVDIVDDLCFLAMECERLGDGDFGKLVFTRCEKVCGSSVPESLFAFYRSYRAMVRAKITLLQSQQRSNIGVETNFDVLVRQYLDLADRHAMALGPPCVLIIGGLMGTGKSTLAQRLADAFDIEVLSTDHVRRSLQGASNLPAGYGEDNYRPEMRGRVYDALLSQAKDVLGASQSVILDGTFLTGQTCEIASMTWRWSTAPCHFTFIALVLAKYPMRTFKSARRADKVNLKPASNFTICRHESLNHHGPTRRQCAWTQHRHYRTNFMPCARN